jgi:preprotein translocase subunit SecF
MMCARDTFIPDFISLPIWSVKQRKEARDKRKQNSIFGYASAGFCFLLSLASFLCFTLHMGSDIKSGIYIATHMECETKKRGKGQKKTETSRSIAEYGVYSVPV